MYFSDICVLLLSVWLIHNYKMLLAKISSSFKAVISRSLTRKTRINIGFGLKKTFFLEYCNIYLLLQKILLLSPCLILFLLSLYMWSCRKSVIYLLSVVNLWWPIICWCENGNWIKFENYKFIIYTRKYFASLLFYVL